MVRARKQASPAAKSWVDTKISATVIDFGQPMIEQLPAKAGRQLLEQTFKLLVTFWNVNVLATHWGQPEHRETTRQKFLHSVADRSMPIEALTMFEQLCRRYQLPRFAADPRAVGHWELRHLPHGQINLRCDARLPPGMDSPKP